MPAVPPVVATNVPNGLVMIPGQGFHIAATPIATRPQAVSTNGSIILATVAAAAILQQVRRRAMMAGRIRSEDFRQRLEIRLYDPISKTVWSNKEAHGQSIDGEVWTPPMIFAGTRKEFYNKKVWIAKKKAEEAAKTAFERMDWVSTPFFPVLKYEESPANDYAGLRQTERRERGLERKTSWYERHGFVRRELLWG